MVGREAGKEKGWERGGTTQKLENRLETEEAVRHGRRHLQSRGRGQRAPEAAAGSGTSLSPPTPPRPCCSPCLPTAKCQRRWG